MVDTYLAIMVYMGEQTESITLKQQSSGDEMGDRLVLYT